MKKKLVWLIVVMILIIVGVMIVGFRPSVGQIKTGKTTERQIEPEKRVKYEGKYLSFEHWDRYMVQMIDNQNENILENVRLVGKSGIMTEVVVTLKNDPATSVEDVSGVKIRQLKNEDYSEESINWNGVEGMLFKKNDGFELTAFFLKEGKSMTVSMTINSNETKNNLEEFQKLVGSVVWK
jgi:hypothetical protein